MIDQFATIGSSDPFFNFCEEPVVVSGQLVRENLHGLKYEGFRFAALLGCEPVQFTFEFGRELNFHMFEWSRSFGSEVTTLH
jgi:hypothetical protein